jgi:glycosyltransferase involved in cell wall biosynthesis
VVKVLVISYNALPMDVVSSYRAKAYCDHLISFGIRPTLLTHRWEKVNNDFSIHQPDADVLVEENRSCRVIRLPYLGTDNSPTHLHTLWSYLCGNLDVALAGSYRIFKQFLWEHLQNNRYDLIIAIYNPHFHLKLAYECWQKFHIPYVLDFRDLWDNEIVTLSYHPGVKERIINSLVSRRWRKWIRHSLFFSTTGSKWNEYLSGLAKKDGITVRNGFDYHPADIPSGNPTFEKKFKVVHFGKVYKNQEVDVFISGFRAFAKRYSAREICLEIIGLKKIDEINYEQKFQLALNEYVTFIPYMAKEELVRYCKQDAALFFFPNFKEDNGQFPVKLYDYIMIGKNMVVCPGGGQIGEFVQHTHTGTVLNKPAEVSEYLENAYQIFKKFGSIPFLGDTESLNRYSRKNQVQIMADKIHAVLCTQ